MGDTVNKSQIVSTFLTDYNDYSSEDDFDYSLANEDESLKKALVASKQILNLFYLNRFDEAFAKAERNAHNSLYHSYMKSSLISLYALLTLEKNEIDKAKSALERTCEFCNKKRRSNSFLENFSSVFRPTDFGRYSDYELHAEIIHAESQVLMALITFFGDQNLFSIIRAAFLVRAANQSFKFCYEAFRNKKTWISTEILLEYESGVSFGIGVFNLYLSILPDRILRILSLAGFSSDYKRAITMLKRTIELKECLRFRFSAICVKAFYLYVIQIGGLCYFDYEWIEEILNELRSKFPKAIFVQIFSAKFNLMNGDLDKAIEEFNHCIVMEGSWVQIKNICRWDLMWAFAINEDWKNAAVQAKHLLDECSYSPASNAYQVAMFKMMQGEDEQNDELKAEAFDMLKKVVNLRRRYVGKTIPQEKFFCNHSVRYKEEGIEPLAALLEMFYIWNVLSLINNKIAVDSFIHRINKKSDELERRDQNFSEQLACLLLAKGVILRNLNNFEGATECLTKIIQSEKQITRDIYLTPHAALELGITYFKSSNYVESRKWLQKAKKNEKKFLNEANLHIRIHSFLKKIDEIEK
ncbi:tetratricopeptide repeat protein 39B-like protein, partial [Dinothrombium tinctorium]